MSETLTEGEQTEEPTPAPDETPGLEPDEEEAETEEEAAPAEPEPEQPPEPETKADRELQKKLEQAKKTYIARVKTLLGDQAQLLTPCEICSDGVLGAHYPVEWMEGENDVQTRLLEVLRGPATMEYEPAPNVKRCGTCQGKGRVSSGSIVAGNTDIVCPACKGYGYEPPPIPGNNGYGDAAQIESNPSAPSEPLASGDADNWGTLRLLPDGQQNPNYGKQPAYWDMSLPHGGV